MCTRPWLPIRRGDPRSVSRPWLDLQRAETTERLRMLLRQRFCPPGASEEARLARVVAILMDYLRQEQALVRAAGTIQQRINRLLGRPAPRQPLTAFDLHLFY